MTVAKVLAGVAAPAARAAAGVLLALLVLVDALAAELSWPLVPVVAVTACAVSGLLEGDRRRAVAMTWVAVVTSLVGTTAVVVTRSPGVGLSEVAALLLVLVTRWRRAAGRGDGLLVAAMALALLAIPLRLEPGAEVGAAVPMVAAVAVAGALAVSLRGRVERREATVALVRRAEREEIARELHDVVAHHVTGIVVTTQAARTVVGLDPGAVSAALGSIEAAGSEAMTSMRAMVGVLRSEPPAGAGTGAPRVPASGVDDLADLVQRFRDAGAASCTQLSITWVAPGARPELPPEVQAGVYRVVQESLTNVRRHAAGAARVTVAVVASARALTVEVVDSGGPGTSAGRGPWNGAAAPEGGFGIVGMRERAEALGGTLSAGPQPSGGWAVRAVVPLAAPPGRRRSR